VRHRRAGPPHRRFGGHHNLQAKKKAAVAVAHTLILIIYCVLERRVPYEELGQGGGIGQILDA
jgi:hypothetical protein